MTLLDKEAVQRVQGILVDAKTLKPYTKWIRSFSCIEGNEHIPRLAHKQGLKTMVGAWLSDDDEKMSEK